MDILEQKKLVAKAACELIQPNEILGLGTGSTVDCLIAELAPIADQIKGVVSSSERTTKQIIDLDIPIIEPSEITEINLYIDGADEINHALEMVKGGGGALTREKIVAAHAKSFICIADSSKLVDTLGAFPLPIEVIPMSAHYVMREVEKLGGIPSIREGFITDNGNVIVDVKGLTIENATELESHLNQITGVVTNGLFAMRKADLLLLATPQGVKRYSLD